MQAYSSLEWIEQKKKVHNHKSFSWKGKIIIHVFIESQII